MTGLTELLSAPAGDAEVEDAPRPDRLLLIHHLARPQAREAAAAAKGGADVACLTAEPSVLERLGIPVTVLGLDALPDFESGSEVESVFDMVQLVYDDIRARSPLPAQLCRVLRTDDVDCFFRRWLLRDVSHLFALALLAGRLELARYTTIEVERHWPNGPAYGTIAEVLRENDVLLPARIAASFGRLSFQAATARDGLSPLRTTASALLGYAELWMRPLRKLRPAARAAPRIPLLIRSYATGWGMDIGGQRRLRNLDFVVDGELLRAEEVGFWLEPGVSDEQRRALLDSGYTALRETDLRIGPVRFLRATVPRLLVLTPVFLRLLRTPRWLHEPVTKLCSHYMLWLEISAQVKPAAFLAVNDLQAVGIARSIALRENGCTSVEYEFSSHWRADARAWIPDYVYAFSALDVMVSWGPLHTAHFENHRGSIRRYWEVGCIWSEHARTIAEGPELRACYQAELERSLRVPLADFRRLVAVFDTSPSSMLSPNDLTAFYAGVLRVAARLPDVLFVCKPKNPLERIFGQNELPLAVERDLRAAGNVVVLHNLFETAAIVALTDLSISACFTSTLIESMGCGKPSLYYDPTHQHLDAFWHRYPSLVCVTEDELHDRVVELLEQYASGQYDEYLRRHCLELEGYFDGGAITRFRALLAAELRR